MFQAIVAERAYQEAKWGTLAQHPHDVAGWLLVMRKELDEALTAWASTRGDDAALLEILQVVSVGVACLEQHGVVQRP